MVLRLAADAGARVQRKQNGIVLGTLIGAGVGFALGLPIASIGANEGTEVVTPLLFMTGVGAATGAGLDALLWRKRIVYTRQRATLTVAPFVGADRIAVFASRVF